MALQNDTSSQITTKQMLFGVCMSHQDDIRKLLINYNRRLQALMERKALYGLDTPIAILTEIEDIEVEVEKLQAELEELEHETNQNHQIASTATDVGNIEYSTTSVGTKSNVNWLWNGIGVIVLVLITGVFIFFALITDSDNAEGRTVSSYPTTQQTMTIKTTEESIETPRPKLTEVTVSFQQTVVVKATEESTEILRPEPTEVAVSFQRDINIRSGPGTDYAVIGFGTAGESVRILGHNADQSWIQIEYLSSEENVGWVYAALVEINGDLQAIPLATAGPPEQFKSRIDFDSDFEYSQYIQSVIKPGLRVRALSRDGPVKKGMEGTYFGTGGDNKNSVGLFIWDDDLHVRTYLLPGFPDDKRTHGYWIYWYDIEIILNSSTNGG